MTIDRAERAGFGIAFAGHVLLIAILSAGVLATRIPPPVKRQAIEVQLVDEVGLESGAPQISEAPPAPRLAPEEGPVEPTPPPPLPAPEPTPAPVPEKAAPAPTPAPAPKPKPVRQPPAKPAAQAEPTKKPAVRSTGRLKGLLAGLSDSDSDSRSTAPPASRVTAAVQTSLAAEVRRQLKPYWSPPTGADVEKLKTVLKIDLARDGSVTSIDFVETSGINASNRAQAQLHKERAIKAVRLASPFKLPAQFYDGWKSMTVNFDQRLSL